MFAERKAQLLSVDVKFVDNCKKISDTYIYIYIYTVFTRVIHAHSLEQATWCIASEAVSSCLGQFSWSFMG